MKAKGGGRRAELYFAEEWGLETAPKRRRHARLVATIDVGVIEPSERSVFRLPPSKRMPALRTARKERVKTLGMALEQLGTVEIESTSHWLHCRVRVGELERVRRVPGIGSVWIRRVAGLRRSPRPPREEWFSVRGRVMIQVEGQTRGHQEYEDRILLVRAKTFAEAERRAAREFAKYAHVYLGATGRRIRWKLEKIIDVYETDLERLDPNGTEVWSSLHSRKLQKEHAWHPDD